jgi:hypothetical protein
MVSINQHHLKGHRMKSQPKMNLCLFLCPTLGWTMIYMCPVPRRARNASTPRLMLGQGHVLPNFTLSHGMSAPNAKVGKGTSTSSPTMGHGCFHAQPSGGLRTQPCPTPCWALARPSLTILEYSHKLNPTPTRKVCELNPTPPRLSAWLKGNSYSGSRLVIMILITSY